MDVKGKKLLCNPPAMAVASTGDDQVSACLVRVDEMVRSGEIDTASGRGAALVEAVIAAENGYLLARRAAQGNFMAGFSSAVEKYSA